MATPKVTFKTDDDVRKQYAGYYTDYEKGQNKQANQQRADVNKNYDSAQRDNYVSYMMNKRELPAQLASLGVTGGGSETAAIRSQTNYENNRNLTERGRNADLKSISDALANNLNSYRQQNNLAMQEALEANRNARNAYYQQLQDQEENRFANTISGWDNVGAIDNEIARLQKSGADPWKIPYLRAQRAALLQQAAASSYSGGGGGYYGGSYTGGGVIEEEPVSPFDNLLSQLKTKSQNPLSSFSTGLNKQKKTTATTSAPWYTSATGQIQRMR